MSNLLTEAKDIIATNKTGQAARDFMSSGQRDALADDYAVDNQFLSAAHFHSDADRRKEFERLFRENIRPKNI